MSDLLELTPLSFVYGGDCLGRLPDGQAVFVPFALPGERLRLRLTEQRRGHARAELLEVLQPSPQRIAPRCPHFTHCGGCHYQHLPYPLQLEVKTAVLAEQLARLGGLPNPPIRPIVPSPRPWNYRNHIQFHLTPDGRLGFQAARSNHVIPIGECHLPEEPLNRLWPQFELEPIPGLERLGLRLGADGEALLVLESRLPQPPALSIEELPLSAVHLSPAGTLVLAGSEALIMEVLGRPFRVSAASFFQVNTLMAAAMVEHLLQNLDLPSGGALLEIYAGVGLFSAFLAPQVGRIIAIEASPSAGEDFAYNLDQFDHVELYQAEAEIVLGSLDFHPDLILVDPPRAGLSRQALAGLLAQRAPRLVYISCDPATLARDAARLLAAGYRLDHLTPFDLFPQTYHIESISFWSRPA